MIKESKIRQFRPGLIILAVLVAGGLLVGTVLMRSSLSSAMTVSSVTPGSGLVTGGQKITINGTDFEQNVEWRQVAAGISHTCAIAIDGRVYCWGDGGAGQLGDGVLGSHFAPAMVINTGGALYANGKTIVGLAANAANTCALVSDGRVYCWGGNSYGQLGDGTTINRSAPTAVVDSGNMLYAGGKAVVSLAVGQHHTCALVSDGRVYCWGRNDHGQLGDNTTIDHVAPAAVVDAGGVLYGGGKTVLSLVAGYEHTCALVSDGAVYCWGRNNYGQLGDNTTTDRLIPTTVVDANNVLYAGGQTVVDLATSYYHTCAIASDGRAYCWGFNWDGQLGDGTSWTNSLVPVAVVDANGVLVGKNIVKLTTGGAHTCALADDGRAYCWGLDNYGQLGDGISGGNRLAPVAVDDTSGVLYGGGKTIISLTIGEDHTCAVSSDHRSYCWGYNGDEQLGSSVTAVNPIPIAVTLVRYLPIVTLDNLACTDITLVDNTTITCFTPRHARGLVDVVVNVGNGTKTMPRAYEYYSPTLISVAPSQGPTSGGTSVTITGKGFEQNALWRQVVIGGEHTCGIAINGRVYCWGRNNGGQLGDGTTTNRFVPAPVVDANNVLYAGGKTVVSLTIGYNHTCALASDDQAYCWGNNANGQLGNGTWTNSPVPVAINDVLDVLYSDGKTILDLAIVTAGHTCALASDGKVYCWGGGAPVPLAVDDALDVLYSGGKTVVSLTAGIQHVCALASDGKAYCWRPGYSDPPTPVDDANNVLYSGGKRIISLVAGDDHTCALASDGKVYCWGRNNSGQFGDGTMIDSSYPVAVVDANNVLYSGGKTVVSLAAGKGHTCALASDGKVYCWGSNEYGQLGDGAFGGGVVNLAPTPVDDDLDMLYSGGKTAVGLAGGGWHTCALASDGKVYCWGRNNVGQLGNTTTINSAVPTVVNWLNLPIVPVVSAVTFDGLDCTNVIVLSDTRLTCVTPAHGRGFVDVVAVINGEVVVLRNGFEYVTDSAPDAPGTGVKVRTQNSNDNSFGLLMIASSCAIVAVWLLRNKKFCSI